MPPRPTARSSTIASGSARSVSEVYSVLTSRYASAANSPATRTAMASAGGDIARPVTMASATPAAPAIDNAAYLSSFPDSRSVTPVRRNVADRVRAERAPIFRSLFQAGERTAADLAGGAGIVGQRLVADIGGVGEFDDNAVGTDA